MGNRFDPFDPERTFGDVLRRFRRAAGLTQEQLAERARLSVRGLSDLERGINHLPRRETVLALAEALQLGEADRAALLQAARRRDPRNPAVAAAPEAVPEADARAGPTAQPLVHPVRAAEAPVEPAPPTPSSVAPGAVEPTTTSAGQAPPADSQRAAASGAPAQAPPVVDQRRLVTVFFADPSDASAADGTADPEDARLLLAHYHERARRVIGEHGGALEQFIGDTVMAVFGLPRAHGDDAERALAAALALRDALGADPLLAGRIHLHIGINTGEVLTSLAVGAPALAPTAREVAITGDAVRVASRFYNAAEAGQILAGERTVRAAESSFEFGPPVEIDDTSRGLALRAYPLVGVRQARRTSRPPLVGRRHELAQLNLLYERVVEEQRPQLISVVAPAGTGKTRLLEEFLAQLAPSDRERAAIAPCPPYGQSLTYWPLRRLLTTLLDGKVTPEAAAAVFTSAGYSVEDAMRLAGAVLATLRVERASAEEQGAVTGAGTAAGTGTSERESIFQAWRLLLGALARETPRIIVWEDLHWASDSMLDLVEHLMHTTAQAPLLFIALSRPELVDRRPSWGGGWRDFTSLALPPLSAPSTRQLVEHLSERIAESPLPGATREQIVTRSGGNPFFAIELVRGVAEQRRLGEQAPSAANPPEDRVTSGANGTASRRRPLGSARVGLAVLPDTVHEAIQARIDQLSPDEREALQVGAVAGRLFRVPALRAILADRQLSRLAAALEGLLARDLIVQTEAEAYTFRHMLIREVAYRGLSRAERIRLHAALAAWQEAWAADRVDELAELIAYHYREAAALAREAETPLPFAPERAIDFLTRAGELASRAGAYSEAASFIRSALALAPEEQHLALYELLGDCSVSGENAREGFQQALDLWRAQPTGQDGQADVVESSCRAHLLTGARLTRKLLEVYFGYSASLATRPSVEEAEALGAEAERLATAAGDEDEVWRARVARLAWAWFRTDFRPQEAERDRAVALEAAAYFERRGEWVTFSRALDAYVGLSYVVGAHRDALAAAQRRLDAPRLPIHEYVDAINTVAKTQYFLGDRAACIATMRAALADARFGASLARLADGAAWALWAAYESGYWSAHGDLLPPIEAASDEFTRTGGRGGLVAFGYVPAFLIALAHDQQQAVSELASLICRAVPNRMPNGRALVAAEQANDPDKLDVRQGKGHELWILTFLCEHGIPAPGWVTANFAEKFDWSRYQSQLEIAQALAEGDDTRVAAAIDRAAADGLVVHAARMRIVLAQRTGDVTQLERARPVLEKLGDRRALRRLEAVAAELLSRH